MTYAYDAWGKLLSTTGSLASTVGAVNPFLYRSYYYDSESGLYYLNSRYYDPQIGRFVSEDGQFNPETGLNGNNLFVYCNNRPINCADYDGTRFTEFDDGTGRSEYVDSTGFMHQGSGTKHLPTKSTAPKKAANNVNAGLSTTGTAVSTYLKQAERFKPTYKSNGSVYFEKYLKYAKSIKILDYSSAILTAGFAAWDLHDIWSNANLTIQQQWQGTGIVAGGIAGGFLVGYLATAAANAWNPVGWGMLAAGAVVLVGGGLISVAQEQAYKKVGIN